MLLILGMGILWAAYNVVILLLGTIVGITAAKIVFFVCIFIFTAVDLYKEIR